MTSQDAITHEADQLRFVVEPAIAGQDDVARARRTTVRHSFTTMSQLLDTAMIRTAGVVETLSDSFSVPDLLEIVVTCICTIA